MSSTLPPLVLTDDPGVNYFIKKVNQIGISSTVTLPSIPDVFYPIYIIPSSTTINNIMSVFNSRYGVVIMNNSGSIKYYSALDNIEGSYLNNLIPNSGVVDTDPNNLILTKPTSNQCYWLSKNKNWILYYSSTATITPNNSVTKVAGFALYYNPIYRPGFLDFSAKNITGNVLPFFTRYCEIMSSNNIQQFNPDINCAKNPGSLPSELTNFTQRIIDLPTATPSASNKIVDSIKISKNGNANLTVSNVTVLDLNGNNIVERLSRNSKSCNFANATNPYLYIYFGDFYVSQVIIEGDKNNYNLVGATVELLNNTSVEYTTTLTDTPIASALTYTATSYLWDVSSPQSVCINDSLVRKLRITKETRNTIINLSEVQLFDTNNTNVTVNKTITTNFNLAVDNNLVNSLPTPAVKVNNPSFTVELGNQPRLVNQLKECNIFNFSFDINSTQNVVVELLDINDQVIVKSIRLPAGYYTYNWTLNNNQYNFDKLGALPAVGIGSWYTGESFDLATKTWRDLSGNDNNVSSDMIVGNFETELINGKKAIKNLPYSINQLLYIGSIGFPNLSLKSDNYTLFTIARYTNASDSTKRRRIFDGVGSGNWLSGFSRDKVGVAFRNSDQNTVGTFITPETSIYGTNNITNWVLSSDQRKLYRANGIDRTDSSKLSSALDNQNNYPNQPLSLTINWGNYSDEWSEWSVAEIIYYNRKLNAFEILLVEKYLKNKYNLENVVDNLANPQPILTKRIKIVKPFFNSTLNLDQVKILGYDNTTIIADPTVNGPVSNTGTSTTFAEIVLTVPDNGYLQGDYVGAIAIKRNNVADMLQGCYLQNLDASGNVLSQSDILIGGADRVSVLWDIKNNDLINYNDNGDITRFPLPEFKWNGENLPWVGYDWTEGNVQNINCPNGTYIKGVRGIGLDYHLGTYEDALTTIDIACGNENTREGEETVLTVNADGGKRGGSGLAGERGIPLDRTIYSNDGYNKVDMTYVRMGIDPNFYARFSQLAFTNPVDGNKSNIGKQYHEWYNPWWAPNFTQPNDCPNGRFGGLEATQYLNHINGLRFKCYEPRV